MYTRSRIFHEISTHTQLLYINIYSLNFGKKRPCVCENTYTIIYGYIHIMARAVYNCLQMGYS